MTKLFHRRDVPRDVSTEKRKEYNFNNESLNRGSYIYDFDASHLASGAYYYRITADGFTDVKKMILVK